MLPRVRGKFYDNSNLGFYIFLELSFCGASEVFTTINLFIIYRHFYDECTKTIEGTVRDSTNDSSSFGCGETSSPSGTSGESDQV